MSLNLPAPAISFAIALPLMVISIFLMHYSAGCLGCITARTIPFSRGLAGCTFRRGAVSEEKTEGM